MEDEEMEKKVQEYLRRKGCWRQGDRGRLPASALPKVALDRYGNNFWRCCMGMISMVISRNGGAISFFCSNAFF
ncbi:hypothetical protein BS78_10G208500 [Paspalum vaginatum]|nr:hypothetical protein BS78_10G208500 [Paspalum vaginatum]